MMIYRHSIAVVATWHHRHVVTWPFSTRHHHFHYHHTTGLETHTNDDHQSPAIKGLLPRCALFFTFFFCCIKCHSEWLSQTTMMNPNTGNSEWQGSKRIVSRYFFLLLFLYTNDYYSTPGSQHAPMMVAVIKTQPPWQHVTMSQPPPLQNNETMASSTEGQGEKREERMMIMTMGSRRRCVSS